MPAGKVFLDANILVYAQDKDSPSKQRRSREVIGALVPTAQPAQAISPQVAATGADARLTLIAETPGGNLALTEWQNAQT